MRINTFKVNQYYLRIAIGLVSSMAIFPLFAEDSANKQEMQNTTQYIHTQSLAASCAACHGASGNPVEHSLNQVTRSLQLAGMPSEKFIAQMQSFKSGGRVSTVMHHHAKGLTDQEIMDLGMFFSHQKIQVVKALSNQPYQMHGQE